MDYFQILQRAFKITLKNKYLWIFGILAGGASSGLNASFPNSGSFPDQWEPYFNQAKFENFWLNFGGIILIIAALLLILGLGWFILSIISQGAILGSVEAIEKNQKTNFWLGFRYGWHKFWRVLAVGLLLFLIILFSIIVLALPIILFILAKIYVLAIIYGLLFFLADLVLWLFLGVTYPYIQRLAVLGDFGSWKAFVSSWEFFKKNWKEILITYLVLMAVGLGAGMALLLVILLIGGLLFAIGFGLYLASMAVFWMYVAVFGFAFLLLITILMGILSTFSSVVFTLTYLELTKKSSNA